MSIITRPLLGNTTKILPPQVSSVFIFGRLFTSQRSALPRNPVKPSWFPNIVEEEKSLARQVISLNLDTMKRRVTPLFSNLTENIPACDHDQPFKKTFNTWTTPSSNIPKNNLLVENYENNNLISKNEISFWAVAHLHSGYTNPPLVLKAISELADTNEVSTHFVNGLAYGIMSQTAKELRDDFSNNKVNLDLYAYYRRCFYKEGELLPYSDDAFQESLSSSIKELKIAYNLDTSNPDVNYYLISQLLESGDITSAVKLSSQFVFEKENSDPESMTFEEIRTLIFSSAVTGKSSHESGELVEALNHKTLDKDELDTIVEALSFVKQHTQSQKSYEFLSILERVQ